MLMREGVQAGEAHDAVSNRTERAASASSAEVRTIRSPAYPAIAGSCWSVMTRRMLGEMGFITKLRTVQAVHGGRPVDGYAAAGRDEKMRPARKPLKENLVEK